MPVMDRRALLDASGPRNVRRDRLALAGREEPRIPLVAEHGEAHLLVEHLAAKGIHHADRPITHGADVVNLSIDAGVDLDWRRGELAAAIGSDGPHADDDLTPAEFRAELSRLHREGYRPIRPDIVFTRQRIAVFIDGCFWHGCPRHYTAPAGNASFWNAKIQKNRARDARNNQTLEAQGWRVLRFWECEVEKELDRVVGRIQGSLLGQQDSLS